MTKPIAAKVVEPELVEPVAPEPVETPCIIVSARDTWGSLIAAHGDDIAARNGMHHGSDLVAGTVLH